MHYSSIRKLRMQIAMRSDVHVSKQVFWERNIASCKYLRTLMKRATKQDLGYYSILRPQKRHKNYEKIVFAHYL